MDISVISLRDASEAERLMGKSGLTAAGLKIMAPKSVTRLVMVRRLPIFAANILKQETLSLGADTAVSKQALTGKATHTDCLIIGSLSRYHRLCQKLKRQPYGLSRLSSDLETVLSNYQKNDFILDLGRYKLNLQSHTHIMGIINLTPDSFSGDGLLTDDARGPPAGYTDDGGTTEKADYELLSMPTDWRMKGRISWISGESSRPGARPVSP